MRYEGCDTKRRLQNGKKTLMADSEGRLGRKTRKWTRDCSSHTRQPRGHPDPDRGPDRGERGGPASGIAARDSDGP